MNYSQHLGITTGQVEGLGYDRPGARRMSDLLNRLIDDAIHYESRISSDTELGGLILEPRTDAGRRRSSVHRRMVWQAIEVRAERTVSVRRLQGSASTWSIH